MAKTYTSLTSISTGDVLTATNYNNLQTNSNNFRVPPSCQAYHNTTQAIATGTWTALTWNSENWDTDTIHDTSTNPTRFTTTTAGLYLAQINATWAANATGLRGFGIRSDGSTFLGSDVRLNHGAGSFVTISGAWIISLTGSQYVEFVGYQESGGSLNVSADAPASGTYARASVTWLGQVS